jgi:predicted helicase
MIHRPGQAEQLFLAEAANNRAISVTGVGSSKQFSALITDCIPDIQLQMNDQAFPLYYYEKRKRANPSLFNAATETETVRIDSVSDFMLARALKQYGNNVRKEDIFYFVYGILYSPDYRAAFANDFKKMLPRIPLVDDVREFWAFSKAGRKLADLHIGYEDVSPYESVEIHGANSGAWRIEKMRFAKKEGVVKGKTKKVVDTSCIIFNSLITVSNIPEKAYEFIVNGKPAIEWIMERYQVKTDKNSGIKNDPNDWAEEVGNPRYILDLLLSIINVSMQTVEIVENLPRLEFDTA